MTNTPQMQVTEFQLEKQCSKKRNMTISHTYEHFKFSIYKNIPSTTSQAEKSCNIATWI